MTHHRIHPRLPDDTERVVSTDLDPCPDGSLILTRTTVGKPLELTGHRFFLDQYATWSLMFAVTRDLSGIEDPGPTPEFAALLDAVRSGDKTAIAAANDGLNDRILSLWTDGGADA